jgi:uncharacterized protein YndB with AHSA1/START domain
LLKKVFAIPVSTVWEAWAQPEHIVKWWAPKGMEVKIVEHDFKVGGRWKYTMVMPDGTDFISEGVYSEIIPMKKIVTSADFKPMTEGVIMQTIFEEIDNQTHLTFSIIHPTAEYRDQQEKMGFYNGWGTAFARLEGYLMSLNK